ncbi:hypothetical protein C0W54_08525 [Photobacterium kishitanii]|nr:hypothetical protein C0W54_08525 [Photobacterium kishitanii]
MYISPLLFYFLNSPTYFIDIYGSIYKGTCQHCGESLPEECAKLKAGGLFKGDARCWYTMNRARLANFVSTTCQ